jgi:hypothetical protein
MNIKLIKGIDFINSFASVANEIYKYTGDYKEVFEHYEGELTEDEIEQLFKYCEKNNLLED